MRRALALLAALMVLAAVPAVAQAPYQADFRFQLSGGSSWDDYGGTLDGGSWFQVFCVQPFQYVYNNELYDDAWITPLNASDRSHILNGTGQKPGNSGYTNAPSQYLAAAQIARIMGTNGSGNWTTNDLKNIQYAIWSAMGFNVSNYSGYNQARVNYFTQLGASFGSVDPARWAVVTDLRRTRQEFIFALPDDPTATVPEPATMTLLATGLVGMAAAGRRKRRQAQAEGDQPTS